MAVVVCWCTSSFVFRKTVLLSLLHVEGVVLPRLLESFLPIEWQVNTKTFVYRLFVHAKGFFLTAM
jgi:hypothetical protein